MNGYGFVASRTKYACFDPAKVEMDSSMNGNNCNDSLPCFVNRCIMRMWSGVGEGRGGEGRGE